jgi:hypothetical protein
LFEAKNKNNPKSHGSRKNALKKIELAKTGLES